jgi:hypothetical protein
MQLHHQRLPRVPGRQRVVSQQLRLLHPVLRARQRPTGGHELKGP